MAENKQRLHAIVEGIVQGVGFRFFVYHHGQQLNLEGWVRNKIDGSVEVLAEGTRTDLDAFLEIIRSGPPMAQVVNTQINWSDCRSDLPPFTVLPTDY